ncbi:uncharacterized protein PITG_03165 [Phytophthora infestans T30-4]|uniref:Uncharacterized protein n=1 Tax=Phytophthora infestans (strain T30-4) TaxID=403677 RepID=D0MZJ0_PHYIT|nr:uncharacterized protein PITG_03165 [Phytophthora infestans T30-4]EEY65653.1 conserved hypothetical protein [Phytophthora infestans T30-4]|eukprot:XP_002906252.1 conserved hypothetical protein [Phytophthora infestans T30-4]
MHDPRIPRGSVFAPVNTSRSSEGREKAKKRRNTANKRRSNNNRNHVNAFKTMAGPSNGYNSHYAVVVTSISLASNLIEQTQPTSERESFSQTDEFLSRTIEESDGLFNFDVEVKPLLNVLVNKTLAQALLEVKEEQEMQILHCQHEVLKAEKSDARQEERELEEKAKEANRRKELVKKKKDEQQIHDQIMRRKLFAWQFSRPLVSQAIDQATATLQNKGVFYDPMLRNLVIWLSKGIYDGADNVICLRGLATELLDGTFYIGSW